MQSSSKSLLFLGRAAPATNQIFACGQELQSADQ
jgi:hypothetical protein